MDELVERHRRACAEFARVAHRVPPSRWSVPTPCPQWSARDLVEHVIGFHEVLILRPLEHPARRPRDGAAKRWDATVAALFDALATAEGRELAEPLLAALSADVLVHAWDLARATGAWSDLDPELCGEIYEIARGYELNRDGVTFAAPFAAGADADPATRLSAWYGRDPRFVPVVPRQYRAVMFDSARWDGFEFRADDIVICSPAKAGTTWTQMLCALLIFRTDQFDAPLTEISPWIDMFTATRDDVFARLAAQSHRRFIKTHTPLDGIAFPPEVTRICVARDPRDIALSWANHIDNTNMTEMFTARYHAVGWDDLDGLTPPPPPPEDPAERFWLWVDDEENHPTAGNLVGVLQHYQLFWDHRNTPCVGLFHYSDYQADLPREMRRLATLLGIEIDDDEIARLAQSASFERMRERSEQLSPEVVVGMWNDPREFFHRGTTGQWRDVIGDDGARYDARVRALLHDDDLIKWAHGGRNAPG